MSQFVLEIVTPDRKFFEDEVEMVIVRGSEGYIGILKNHAPLVTSLAIGKIQIKQKGETKYAAIAGGYVEITKEKTTIIADSAEWPEEIDVERAKAAKERAERRINSNDENIDVLRAQVALQKSLNRINIVNEK